MISKLAFAVLPTVKKTKLDLPTSDVLKYWFADDTWLAIRPSGTEPKIKFYLGVKAPTEAEATERLTQYEAALQQQLPQA